MAVLRSFLTVLVLFLLVLPFAPGWVAAAEEQSPAAPPAAEVVLTNRYPLEDLPQPAGGERFGQLDAKSLLGVITTLFEPGSWEQQGGRYRIEVLPPVGQQETLLITHTARVHELIGELLGQMRRLAQARSAGASPERDADAVLSPAQKKLAEALRSPTVLEAIETSLGDVIDYLKDFHHIKIRLDREALENDGMGPDTPVTTNLKGIALRSALRLMLHELHLTCILRADHLLITTREAAEKDLSIRLYPVDDLCGFRDVGGVRELDCAGLRQTITTIVAPESWYDPRAREPLAERRGTAVAISRGPARCLAVLQNQDAHEKIADLLDQLRQYRAGKLRPGPAEKRILDALKQPTELEFIGAPLSDVIDYLKDFHGIEIQIDKRCLEEVGVETNASVTRNLKGISLRSALRLMLRELDLAYMIKDEVLLVTTPERAGNDLSPQLYPIADLLAQQGPPPPGQLDGEKLVHLVMARVTRIAWDVGGGPASIRLWPPNAPECLIVSQTPEGHDQIAELLAALRSAASKEEIPRQRVSLPTALGRALQYGLIEATAVDYWRSARVLRCGPGLARRKIAAALSAPVTADFKETPLTDVVDFLKEFCGIEIQIDKQALDDVGVGTDSPVTMEFKNVPLGKVLKAILGPMELTYLVRDEVLLITTSEVEQNYLFTVVYRIDEETAKRLGVEPGDLAGVAGRVKAAVPAACWADAMGRGRIDSAIVRGVSLLIVSQTYRAYEQIAEQLGRRGIYGDEWETTAIRLPPPWIHPRWSWRQWLPRRPSRPARMEGFDPSDPFAPAPPTRLPPSEDPFDP